MRNLPTLKKLFAEFHEAIYIVNTERQILYFNPVAERITGFSSKEMECSFCYDNKLNHIDEDGVQLCVEGCPLDISVREDTVQDHFVYLHHKDGHRVRVHVRTIPHHDSKGKVDGAIEVFSEVTEKNLYFEELKVREALMYIDSLTDTFNRHYLNIEVPKLLKKANDPFVGVAFFDIDKFKAFNDTYGHKLGDLVLEQVSKSVHKNIASRDSLIRYGGDEFVIILFADTEEEIERRIKKIDMLVKATIIRYQGQEFNVAISIGYTVLAKKENLESAIERADKAMYKAKKGNLGQPVYIKK